MYDKFDAYLHDVRKQLNCNASIEYKFNYITYEYSNEDINNHLDYFKDCMNSGLSAYKALLFFNEYLTDNYDK